MHGKTKDSAKRSSVGVWNGFTLVELLVVIAIIAILAALLLAALASSKTQALQIPCLNNIKQVTIAGLMYVTDTAQGLPANQPGLSNFDPNAPVEWWEATANYSIASNVLLCPATLIPPSLPVDEGAVGTANLPWVDLDLNEFGSITGKASSSFGMNGYLYEMITPYSLLSATKLSYAFPRPSSVQKPFQTPFFFDEICIDTFPTETDSAATDLYFGESSSGPAGGGRGMACCTILRHGGRTASSSAPYKTGQFLPGAINMCFDDGHGELVQLQNLWNYAWHLNWNPALVKGP